MGPRPLWSPEVPRKAYSLTYSCAVWRLLGSQAGASPEPEPVGYGGLGYLRPCTPMPCPAVWLYACPFGRGGGGAPPLEGPPLSGLRRLLPLRSVPFGRRPPLGGGGGVYSRNRYPAAQVFRGEEAAGVSLVASGATVPHPPAHCRTQAAHCMCWCVSHIHIRGNRDLASGASRRLARGHLPGGVKRAHPTSVR